MTARDRSRQPKPARLNRTETIIHLMPGSRSAILKPYSATELSALNAEAARKGGVIFSPIFEVEDQLTERLTHPKTKVNPNQGF